MFHIVPIYYWYLKKIRFMSEIMRNKYIIKSLVSYNILNCKINGNTHTTHIYNINISYIL